jgi:hypothetical protein
MPDHAAFHVEHAVGNQDHAFGHRRRGYRARPPNGGAENDQESDVRNDSADRYLECGTSRPLSGPIDHLPFHGDRPGGRDRKVVAPRALATRRGDGVLAAVNVRERRPVPPDTRSDPTAIADGLSWAERSPEPAGGTRGRKSPAGDFKEYLLPADGSSPAGPAATPALAVSASLTPPANEAGSGSSRASRLGRSCARDPRERALPGASRAARATRRMRRDRPS